MKVAVIFFALVAIMSIAGLAFFSFSAVFHAVCNIYQIIIIYSIWRKFQEEQNDIFPEAVPPPIETIEPDSQF